MNKRKLRRVTIVALVLVLLCNTLGVQAETGAPAVTVSSYEELVNAIDQASNLDTILIGAVIWIPEGASHSLHKRLTACKCYGTCNCIHSRG